ncbi:hypothetical protein HJ526_07810 [Donghicola sp. C2-DW-16]|uniref:Uncharacterized protein n=1 Tax=Donghicola mangrovi TaxID=2729614 RepID=A0ABX2PFC1_9RHOB|nr:hypothetical protein [Donghicola mangrovi]NVO27319.1 hypothetical protein [Donghicola mangrovi]
MARDRTDFADRIRPPAPKGAESTVARLEAALLQVAVLMERQPKFVLIFVRLEAELAAAQEAEVNGPLARAKALRDQRARKDVRRTQRSNVVALAQARS